MIENDVSDNKDATRIHQCIIRLITQIDDRLKELPDEALGVKEEDELEALEGK